MKYMYTIILQNLASPIIDFPIFPFFFLSCPSHLYYFIDAIDINLM